MVPPDGATGVPLNATLGAHYMASADYLGEDVVLVHPDGREQMLEARFDPTEVLLSVTPTEPLVAGGAYVVRWPSLRGLNASAPGYGGEAHFTAGTADDTAVAELRGRHRGRVGPRARAERLHGRARGTLRLRHRARRRQRRRRPRRADAAAVPDVRLGRDGDDACRCRRARSRPRARPRRSSCRRAISVGHVCFAALVRDTDETSSRRAAPPRPAWTRSPRPSSAAAASPVPHRARRAAPFAALALLALLARRRKT